jgi:hypothetical protein
MTISQNQSVVFTQAPSSVAQQPVISRRWTSKLLIVGLFLLALLPLIGPILMVYEYGVNVPYWDEWNMVAVVLDSRKGGIPPTLFAQHNEHRIVIPRLVFIALDNLTHWNQFATMTASIVFVFLTSLGIYVLARSTIPPGPGREWKIAGIWFACNMLIFSPAQWENWLWSVGMVNVLPMMFIVWTMIVVRSSMRLWMKMPIALLMATAATFSVGDGILAWPLIGLLWAWSPSLSVLKKKVGLLLIWCGGFAINVAMYFHHYVKPGHAVLAYSVNARAIFDYILAFVGGPLCQGTVVPPATQAMIIGTASLVVLLFLVFVFLYVWWVEGEFDLASSMFVWLVVSAFSVASGILAGPTRAGFGTDQALASRYVTFGVYTFVGLLILPLIITAQRKFRGVIWSHLGTALVTAIIFMQLWSIYPAILASRGIYKGRVQGKAALLLLRSLPDDDPNLALLFPLPTQLRAIAELVNGIGFIHPALVNSNHAREIQIPADYKYKWHGEGHIDQAALADPNTLVASGWAVFLNRARPVEAVFLTWERVGGEPIIFALADTGASRIDVANLLHEPNFEMCGWSVTCPASRLPPGNDPLLIHAWALNLNTGKATQLAGEIKLQRWGVKPDRTNPD